MPIEVSEDAAVEVPAIESAPAESAPAEPAAESAPAEPAWDARQAHQELVKEVSGWREFYQHDQAERQKQEAEFRHRILGTFAPDMVKKEAPRALTAEDLNSFGQSFYEQMEAKQIRREHDSEMAAAKEKYPEVFDAYQGVEHVMRAKYVEDAANRPMVIAKMFQDKLNTVIASKNAAMVAQKTAAQKAVRGNGAPQSKAPPAEGEDHGARGRARLSRLRLGRAG